MLAIERKNEILSILQKEQRVLVAELSQRYQVTEETIRRDLEKLEREGFVKKTYGGAVLNKNSTIDMPLKIREKTNRKEKQRIAQRVASLIEDGESIMLDGSSTSLMIAQELKKKKKLTVITNSVEVLIELAGGEGIKVISTGGTLRESSLSLVGAAALDVLRRYNVDKAILSCKGIDMGKGVTDSHEMEADVKICMRSCAKTTILAADSSKLGNVFFAKIMDLSEGDILVLDKNPKKEWMNFLEKRGVQLVTGNETKIQ
jgi:DeoR/GlpR family transcriptional regulator of sugar metabolism